MTLGEKIKKYRELRGLTQRELGQKVGFSAGTEDSRIRKYEKNIFPSDVLEDIIVESYYKSAEEYFKKHRNTDFVSYVDYKMDYCIKKMNLNK